MRITRKSRATGSDHPFRSRFEQPDGLFPLRQFMRCRDELAHRVILSLVQGGFVVALFFLGWSLHKMFVRHGAQVPGWIEPLALLAILAVVALSFRRMIRNINEINELRVELRRLKLEVQRLEDQA